MNSNQLSRIFISYSHRGNGPKWKEALLRALHVFEQQHVLDVWQDGKIRVSRYWDDDIQEAMSRCGAGNSGEITHRHNDPCCPVCGWDGNKSDRDSWLKARVNYETQSY
jgi:hypothetical protein